jgi:hypothetical protein
MSMNRGIHTLPGQQTAPSHIIPGQYSSSRSGVEVERMPDRPIVRSLACVGVTRPAVAFLLSVSLFHHTRFAFCAYISCSTRLSVFFSVRPCLLACHHTLIATE